MSRTLQNKKRISLNTPWPPHNTLRDALRHEKKRTGLGPAAILSGRKDKPDGLNAGVITGWLNGAIKSVRRDHINYVLRRWREVTPRVRLTKDLRTQLEKERRRTGVHPTALLKGRADLPPGLTPAMVFGWLNGNSRTAASDHLDFVLREWKAISDIVLSPQVRGGHAYARRRLRDEDIQTLQDERRRTGIGVTGLMRLAADAPKGLAPQVINGWLTGKIRSARMDHFAYTLNLWRRLPAAPPKSTPAGRAPGRNTGRSRPARPAGPQTGRENYNPVSPEIRAKLLAERARTNVSPIRLLRESAQKPEGLSATTISAWLSGAIKSADSDYLDWALAQWASLPDA